jgi:hypothetical protein
MDEMSLREADPPLGHLGERQQEGIRDLFCDMVMQAISQDETARPTEEKASGGKNCSESSGA